MRPPVFLARRPREPVDEPPRDFHRRLLPAAAAVRRGAWRPLAPDGPAGQRHPPQPAGLDLDGRRRPPPGRRQRLRPAVPGTRLPLPWDDLRGRPHRLTDLLTSQSYDRDGDELADAGLFVALGPWQTHVLEVAEVAEVFESG
ncbi:hypothetical protein [Streptomyces sp. NY05-11A]|uniref:hypothetical protein n=1 Tax=Streptomyces soliscabiei TaxID=588897 RepID=UPI0039F6E71B